MNLVSFILLLNFIGFKECYSRRTLKLGAILDILDETAEIAFRDAVHRINSDNLEVLAEVKKVSPHDPYATLKMTCSLLHDGVVGILGPISETNANVAQALCDETEIPYLDIKWYDKPLTRTIINVYPYLTSFTTIFIKILDQWGFKEFVILYEKNESLKRVAEMIKFCSRNGCKVAVQELQSDSDDYNYRPILKKLWRSRITHFVLDCSKKALRHILFQAQQIGLMTDVQHYFIANPDLQTVDLSAYQFSETNITGIRLVDYRTEQAQDLISKVQEVTNNSDKFDLNTALVHDVVSMFGEALSYLPNRFDLPTVSCYNSSSWSYGTTIVNYIKRITYSGLSGKVRFDNMGFRTNFNFDIIELQDDNLTKIGQWDSENITLSRVHPNGEAVEEDDNLVNKTLIVTTCITEPYAMLKVSSERLQGNDRFEGFGIDLIHELSKLEKFNYNFSMRPDTANGVFNPETGTWTGMIGELLGKEADLAITDLTITPDRQEVVDFTTQFMNLGISILFQKPQKAPPSFFSFASPFNVWVWILTGVAFLSVSFSLFIIGRICPDEWTNPYPCIEEPDFLVNQLSLRNCFWFSAGAIMQQGSEVAPLSISTRMIAGMWWFFTLIMVSSYTANLSVFLTQEFPVPLFIDVTTLVRYAKEKGISYGAKVDGTTYNFFKTSTHNQDYQTIYKYMEEHKEDVMVKDNILGVRKAAENGTYAFFMESSSIEYQTERICNLQQVGGLLADIGYGIAMRKNATYRHKLSTAVLRLQQNGKLDDLKRKWWQDRRGGGQCKGEDSSGDATPLNMTHVGGVFWVTIAGASTACLLMFVEMMLHVAKKAIKYKIPTKPAIKDELKFYFKFSGLVKPITYNTSSDKESIDTIS